MNGAMRALEQAVADRDRARDLAVHIEQENARLVRRNAALAAQVHQGSTPNPGFEAPQARDSDPDLSTTAIRAAYCGKQGDGLAPSHVVLALCDALDGARGVRDELLAENERLRASQGAPFPAASLAHLRAVSDLIDARAHLDRVRAEVETWKANAARNYPPGDGRELVTRLLADAVIHHLDQPTGKRPGGAPAAPCTCDCPHAVHVPGGGSCTRCGRCYGYESAS